jgi:hypothetical protein
MKKNLDLWYYRQGGRCAIKKPRHPILWIAAVERYAKGLCTVYAATASRFGSLKLATGGLKSASGDCNLAFGGLESATLG